MSDYFWSDSSLFHVKLIKNKQKRKTKNIKRKRATKMAVFLRTLKSSSDEPLTDSSTDFEAKSQFSSWRSSQNLFECLLDYSSESSSDNKLKKLPDDNSTKGSSYTNSENKLKTFESPRRKLSKSSFDEQHIEISHRISPEILFKRSFRSLPKVLFRNSSENELNKHNEEDKIILESCQQNSSQLTQEIDDKRSRFLSESVSSDSSLPDLVIENESLKKLNSENLDEKIYRDIVEEERTKQLKRHWKQFREEHPPKRRKKDEYICMGFTNHHSPDPRILLYCNDCSALVKGQETGKKKRRLDELQRSC